MDNDAINSLAKKWTANLVYCFEDFDNETHSQRLSAYIDQKPLRQIQLILPRILPPLSVSVGGG